MAEYRVHDHTIRPVDPDGYRVEALSWQMAEHIAHIKFLDQMRRSALEYRSPTPVPEHSMSGQDIEEAILKRVELATMRCDFDQARWLLLHIKDEQKAEPRIKELESNIKLHDQSEKHLEMESAKAESDGEWEKARSSLILMKNKVRSGRLLVGLERRQAIQDKYNRGLQEEVVIAQFVHRDLAKACSLVSEMKGKRPKAFVALFKCNEALAKDDFSGARSILSDPQLASAHMALNPMVHLAEALHNDDQEKITSLSLLLEVDGQKFQELLLNSSAGLSAERCDGHVEAPSLLSAQHAVSSPDYYNLFQKRSEEESKLGNWDEAKNLLLKIPDKTVSGPLLRKLAVERSAFYEKDKELEKKAKEAEMNDDWEEARSFLSRIKSDIGKFLLAALAYSEARLSFEDKHMEMLVQLQKEYPDPRLEQVKYTQYFEYADLKGPPLRATDLHSLFVGEKMCGTGVLWSEPDDFRKVFEMMAEDKRDAYDRAWYGLPAPNMQFLTASPSQAQEIHIAEESPSSESMQARLRDCPDTGAPSSSLPAIPRDPCMATFNGQAIREYQWDRPELPALSFDQQLVLLQICLVHKSRYTKSQGNTNFWHRVADQFWEVAGWHWKRIRTFVQTKLRTTSDRGTQMAPLLDELRSHIRAIGHPNNPSSVAHSSPGPLALQDPVGSLPGQGSADRTLSPTGFGGGVSSDSMAQRRLAGSSSRPSELPYSEERLAAQSAAKRTFSQTGFDDEISSDGRQHYSRRLSSRPSHLLSTSNDDMPSHPPSRPRYTGPASSSTRTHTQPLLTEASVQSLIAKSNEAKERHDFDKAKSLLLQIPDKKTFEPLLEELDKARESQIKTNKDIERQAREAELKGDWKTAKVLLSRVAGEDGSFLLLALEYSRTRLEGGGWDLSDEIDPSQYLEQLKKKYPHPSLKQVELDQEFEYAKETGNPQRIGHHQGMLRAYKRKSGSFWEEPDDFRKAFSIMAVDRRHARDKAWYAHPPRARKTDLGSPSRPQPGSGSGLDSRAGLGSETEARSQSQSRPQPRQLDSILGRARTQARSQPQSPQPDIEKEVALLDKARKKLFKSRDKIKAVLRQGASEECKEALKAVELSTAMLMGDLEESVTSLLAQADDESDHEADECVYQFQKGLLLFMEDEMRANEEKFESLMNQMPRNSSQTRSLRKQFAEAQAKKARYLQRCRATLDAGGRLDDVEPEE
ncbi:hypothetical protein PITC_046620 [Penicillium italicum]|uniref:Uncharacterized protein n=1 Tax=Penicillium italicum TaxID=40296 RepID=A0A0A2KMX4_PENIT|nr:hypothetical protein PITC_046620 [Penicillium italicum]